MHGCLFLAVLLCTDGCCFQVRVDEWPKTDANAKTADLFPLEELGTVLRQQRLITGLRERNEALAADVDKLRTYGDWQALTERMARNGSIGSYEQLKAQELEVLPTYSTSTAQMLLKNLALKG